MLQLDIRKIALFLAGKLPPDYQKKPTLHFIRLLQSVDEEYFTDDKIRFIRSESPSDEEFFHSILDSLWRSGNNDSDIKEKMKGLYFRIMKEYEIPKSFFEQEAFMQGSEDIEKLGNKLRIDLLSIVEGKEDAKKYEEVIGSIISFLFKDSMKQFYVKTQVSSENGLDIRDRIMLNNPNSDTDFGIGLWEDIIKKDYDSSFITIECKNYTEPVDQAPIVTTLKYLEKPGIGRFGIMFTRKGLSPSGVTKVVDLLKGNSQKQSICILVLDDLDVNKLIDLKVDGVGPEKYLLDKYFDLQTKL